MSLLLSQLARTSLFDQCKVTAGSAITVHTAEQVTSGSQVEVTVQVTVLDPPQAGGAIPPLLEILVLHPPSDEAKASHAL